MSGLFTLKDASESEATGSFIPLLRSLRRRNGYDTVTDVFDVGGWFDGNDVIGSQGGSSSRAFELWNFHQLRQWFQWNERVLRTWLRFWQSLRRIWIRRSGLQRLPDVFGAGLSLITLLRASLRRRLWWRVRRIWTRSSALSLILQSQRHTFLNRD